MNDYELYKYSQQYVAEAHRFVESERLIKEARQANSSPEKDNYHSSSLIQGAQAYSIHHEPVTDVEIRVMRWLGERLIGAGVRLKLRAQTLDLD